MVYATRAVGVYKAFYYSELAHRSKTVLDCGAGGSNPPLMIFQAAGYKTMGIELSEEAIARADEFQLKNQVNLNITKGDMRTLPLDSNSYGCCYSYNSIFHMTRKDIAASVREMVRVTEPGGTVYFNLLSTRDKAYGIGKEVEPNAFLDEHTGTIHAYHSDDEIEPVIEDCQILEKVFINSLRPNMDGLINQSFIEYYCRKKT